MKKSNVIRLIAVLAALAMTAASLLALTGCAKAATLTGLWKLKSGVYEDFRGDTHEDCYLELKEGGSYTLYDYDEEDGAYTEWDTGDYTAKDNRLSFSITGASVAYVLSGNTLTVTNGDNSTAVFEKTDKIQGK